jgi:hypothetical protein
MLADSLTVAELTISPSPHGEGVAASPPSQAGRELEGGSALVEVGWTCICHVELALSPDAIGGFSISPTRLSSPTRPNRPTVVLN